jgi:hypothetical protein
MTLTRCVEGAGCNQSRPAAILATGTGDKDMKLRIIVPIAAAAMLAAPALAAAPAANDGAARPVAASPAKPKPVKHHRMVRRTSHQRASTPAK